LANDNQLCLIKCGRYNIKEDLFSLSTLVTTLTELN